MNYIISVTCRLCGNKPKELRSWDNFLPIISSLPSPDDQIWIRECPVCNEPMEFQYADIESEVRVKRRFAPHEHEHEENNYCTTLEVEIGPMAEYPCVLQHNGDVMYRALLSIMKANSISAAKRIASDTITDYTRRMGVDNG